MSKELLPPKDLFEFHDSVSEDTFPCYARLKIQKVIEWQKNQLLTEFGKPVSSNISELLDYGMLVAWQNVNFLNYDPRKPLKIPTYSNDILPAILANLELHNVSAKEYFVHFLIRRMLTKNVA